MSGELVPIPPGEWGLPIGELARIEADARARRFPHLMVAAAVVLAYALWGLGLLVAWIDGDEARQVIVTGGWALVVLGAVIVLVSTRRRTRPTWRTRWQLGVLGAANWVGIGATWGPASWWWTGVLVLAATLLAASWVRAHAVPRPGDMGPPREIEPPVVAPGDLAMRYAKRWAERVGAPGRVLPGTLLTNRSDLPHAVRWTVQTTDEAAGSIVFSDYLQRQPKVAGALHLPASRIVLERHQLDEGWAELTLILRDVLSEGVPYDGPRYRDGRVPLAPYADGSGHADYIACTSDGAKNGLFTGAMGSGKSAAMGTVALGLRASGVWRVWFADGATNGGSSPLLDAAAHWAGSGPEHALRQLEAVEAWLRIRELFKGTLTMGSDGAPVEIDRNDPSPDPLRELLPCPSYPGLCWFLDEFHRLAKDEMLIAARFVPRLEDAIRTGRKYGFGVAVGTQSLLAGDYGNSTPLRGFLSDTNCFAFRNPNKSETATVNGLLINPGLLPKVPGYCYSAGGGRLSMARAEWAPDMLRWVPTLPDVRFDRLSAAAVAPFLPKGRTDPQAKLVERLDAIARWEAEQVTGAAAPAAPTGPPKVTSIGGRKVPGAIPTEYGEIGKVIPFVSRDDQAGDDGLRPMLRTVLDAVRAGKHGTADVAEAIGRRPPQVSKLLGELVDLGYVHRARHGVYRPGPDTTGEATSTG